MVEIVGQGTVTLCWQADSPTFSETTAIEDCWEKRPTSVFNGSLLVHRHTLVENNHIRLTGTFTEYKFYFAQRRCVDLGLSTIGVSGLIVLNEQVVFARRSPHMTGYPNMLELVPSGTIDDAVALADGTVDYVTKMKEEFEEEVGLPQSRVKKVTSFGVTYEPHERAYDILCKLEVDATPQEILASLQQSEEYTEPVLVPFSDLDNWLTAHRHELLPTSEVILKLGLA